MTFKVHDLVSVRSRVGLYYIYYIRATRRGLLYFVKNASNHHTEERGFFEYDLLPMRQDDWIVERVLRRRFNMKNEKEYLVKWLDLNSSFNRWISGEDLNKYFWDARMSTTRRRPPCLGCYEADAVLKILTILTIVTNIIILLIYAWKIYAIVAIVTVIIILLIYAILACVACLYSIINYK